VLSLPQWDFQTSTALAEQLQALGMTDAFGAAADFSGITTDEPLYIGNVIHQANITVTEAGTEAAAATAVGMDAAAAPGEQPEPVGMTVDHPFVFAIRDSASGAVIFHGRVTDPS
jgi:serpin B